jgi:hypothetical protein
MLDVDSCGKWIHNYNIVLIGIEQAPSKDMQQKFLSIGHHLVVCMSSSFSLSMELSVFLCVWHLWG